MTSLFPDYVLLDCIVKSVNVETQCREKLEWEGMWVKKHLSSNLGISRLGKTWTKFELGV